MHDYMLHKGYVAINGCSLTVGEVSNESFMIHLIPETLSITNLFQLEQDSIVNIELDQNTIIIADTVKKYLDGKS
jgi:Riboflavin synthase alpha chain